MKPEDFRPTDPAPVEAREEADGRWSLLFVRELRHAPDTVWAALTDPAQLAEWAPYTASRDLGGTGEALLTMLDGDEAPELSVVVHAARRPTLLDHTSCRDSAE